MKKAEKKIEKIEISEELRKFAEISDTGGLAGQIFLADKINEIIEKLEKLQQAINKAKIKEVKEK